MKRFVFVLLWLGYFLTSTGFVSADSWQVIKTDYFEIFYKPGYEAKAKECLTVLTVYRNEVKKLSGKELPKLLVVIEDIGTTSNGMADLINPNIHIYTYPPGTSQGGIPGIGFGENWWRMGGIHESLHISQLTQTSGVPKVLSTLFGNVFLPNLFVPLWIAEGGTVSGESQVSPYEGRTNDGFFDTVLLASASNRPFPSLLEMTYTPMDFPTIAGGSYLYGGLFLNYLREKYGQDKLNEFFKNNGGSFFAWFMGSIFPATGIDDAAKKTYGKSFEQLRLEWQRNYLSKKLSFAIDGNPLTSDKLTLYSDLLSDDEYLYYVKREYRKSGAYKTYKFEKIAQRNIRSQNEKELVSTTSSFTTRPQIFNNDLYYSVAEIKRGFANSSFLGFGIISNLHCKDLATGKDRIILSDALRSFIVIDDNKILYTKDHNDGFGSEFYIYNTQTKEKQLLLKSDILIDQMVSYAKATEYPINDPFRSPKGEGWVSNGENIVVSGRYDWENWGLYLFNIKTLALTEIFNTPYAETSPSISNGRLLFVANYDKRYRIYSYDLTAKKLYQVTQGSYANFPVLCNDELYFVGLNSDGTNLYHKPVVFAEIKPPQYAPTVIPPALEVTTRQGSYLDVAKTMFPSFRLPLISSKGTGAFLSGNDITYQHYYATTFRFGKSPYLTLLYETYFLKPLTIGLDLTRKEDEQDNTLYGNYPLWRKLEPGLSSLSPSLEIRSDEEGDIYRNELAPGIKAVFTYPKSYLESQFNYLMERKSWDSVADRDGLELITTFSHYLKGYTQEPEWGSEVKALSHLISDPDASDPPQLEIRGYRDEDALKTRRGGIFTLEYSSPILRGRDGWWNPNIYWEDIAIVGFADTAFGQGTNPIYSGGAEFRLEAALGFSFRFIPIIGIAMTKDGKKEIYISFMATTQIQGGANRLPSKPR